MTIYEAIQSVAQGHSERIAIPNIWRVWNDHGVVWLEIYPANPIAVTTVVEEME